MRELVDEWAPVLDPQWARTFGALERELTGFVAVEGCSCAPCRERLHGVAFDVVVSWTRLGMEVQRRWLEAYGTDERGAVLRDALVELGPERVAGLQAMADGASDG